MGGNNHKMNETCQTRLSNLEECQMQIEQRVAVLSRAMFGEKETKQKGVVDMTKEMHDIIVAAKGGKSFIILLATIIGSATTVVIFVKKFF